MFHRSDINKPKYASIFTDYDVTGFEYSKIHYLETFMDRFFITRDYVHKNLVTGNNYRLLDIGAHCLHQSLIYAIDGLSVNAVDIEGSGIATLPAVKNLAKEFHIELLTYKNLEIPMELECFPDNHFDILLFTEIIEHLTFNPIIMWKSLYRILKPGAKIYITTPNYFYLHGRFKSDIKNLIRGRSSGVAVESVFEYRTYSPHWKEFSKADLKTYFNLLSKDFLIKTHYINFIPDESRYGIKTLLKSNFPFLFKTNLLSEITITQKDYPISIEPHW